MLKTFPFQRLAAACSASVGHDHRGLRGGKFITQGTPTAISGRKQSHRLSVDHGIVKADAGGFKKIRHATAKN
jgi:hypothetical protein